MKPAELVWTFWLGNLVVLGVIGLFVWNACDRTSADRDARDLAIANLHTEIPRKVWKPGVNAPNFAPDEMRLSPLARPKPPEPERPRPEPPPPVTKTDEQLKSELETELNRRFTLLRMMLSSDERYPSLAHLVCGGRRLMWFEDMYLKEDYAKSKSPELRKLAIDLRVLKIDEEGVLVDAASFEKPEKRFEVRIRVDYTSANMNFSGDLFPREEGVMRPESDENKPKIFPYVRDSDREKAWRWGYPMPDEDESAIDELAKYTKATDNGVQILPELPEDSPARKYGARGGEIIKTINGVSVKSMSDVRRVVRTQYDSGTREFVVGFERDGVPDTRTITAPEKKD